MSKVDGDGKALAGAQFQLLDTDGKVVKEWTSGTEAEVIEGLADGTYTIHEVSAPSGYSPAEDKKVVLGSLSNMPPVITANDAALWGDRTVTGYAQGISLGGHVMYCLDHNSLTPGSPDNLVSNLSKTMLMDPASDTGATAANIRANKEKILAALLIGYPNNMVGLQQEIAAAQSTYMNSSAQLQKEASTRFYSTYRSFENNIAFHRLTQDVIWYYANGLYPGNGDADQTDIMAHADKNYGTYFKMFLDAVEDAVASGAIDGYDATIYYKPASGGKYYQPVVDAEFGSSTSPSVEVTIVNEKSDREITITKKWLDADGKDASAPSGVSVSFDLYYIDAESSVDLAKAKTSDGTKYGEAITLDGSESPAWTKKVSGLPATIDGKAVNYFAIEQSISGYKLDSSTYAAGSMSKYTYVTTETSTEQQTVTGTNFESVDPSESNFDSSTPVVIASKVPGVAKSGQDFGFPGGDGSSVSQVLRTQYADFFSDTYIGTDGVLLEDAVEDQEYLFTFEPANQTSSTGKPMFYIKNNEGKYLVTYRQTTRTTAPDGASNNNTTMHWATPSEQEPLAVYLSDQLWDGSYNILFDRTYLGVSRVYALAVDPSKGDVPFLYADTTDSTLGNPNDTQPEIDPYETGDYAPLRTHFSFFQKTTPETSTIDVTTTKEVEKTVDLVQDATFTFSNKPSDDTTEYNGSIGTTVAGATKDKAAQVKVPAGQTSVTQDVVDTIDYKDLQQGATYLVSGQLIDLTDGEKVVAEVKDQERTADGTSGSWTITFANVELKVGHTYVVYEYAQNKDVPEDKAEHADKTDPAQTVVVTEEEDDTTYDGSLKTTVKGATSTAAAQLVAGADGKITTDVVDTIDYEGLQQGATYLVSGKLVDKADGTVVAEVKDQERTAEGTSGSWTVTFEKVTLEAGHTYVVYEYAQNKDVPEDSAKHEDKEDQAQTVIVKEQPEKGDIATTVEGASDSAAASLSAAEAAAKTSLTDKIDYKNLTPGATYTVSGRLMENGTTEVAKATEELKASSTGSGTWEIHFTFAAGTLKADTKYVVFETATNKDDSSEEPHVHENPDDVAQTVVVEPEETPAVKEGKMATTVHGATASSAAKLTAGENGTITTNVVDTIDYEGLTPGATYVVSGRLMENGTTEVATATAECVASDTGSGSWEITFENVTLEAGKTYVVFEFAQNKDDENDTAKHEDANDQAQTVVVEAYTPSDSGNGGEEPSDNGDNGNGGEEPSDNGDNGNGGDDSGNGGDNGGNGGTVTPSNPDTTSVDIVSDNGNKVTITDKDGNVVEEWTSTGGKHTTNLPAGEYTITVTDKDGNTATRTIRVNNNGTVEEQDGTTWKDVTNRPITVNPIKATSTPTVTTARTASTSPTSTAATTTARTGTTAASTTARTADTAQGALALLGMALALSACVAAFARRRSDQ